MTSVEQGIERSLATRCTRGEFLGGLATLLTGGYLAYGEGVVGQDNTYPRSPYDLADYKILPPRLPTLPLGRGGILVNIPYFYRKSNYRGVIEEGFEHLRELGADVARIYLGNGFEKQFSRFAVKDLDDIGKLSEEAERHGISLQLVMLDGYDLFHANKDHRAYDPKKLSSVYLIDKNGRSISQQQEAFFTDQEIVEKFLKRASFITSHLRSVPPEQLSFEIINEADLPGRSLSETRDKITAWKSQVAFEIRRMGSSRKIVSGLARPNLIYESNVDLDVNTAHLYLDDPTPLSRFFRKSESDQIIDDYLFRHQPVHPLSLDELGFQKVVNLNLGERRLSIPLYPIRDRQMADFINRVMFKFIEVDVGRREVRVNVSRIGLWRLTFGQDRGQFIDYWDGYEFTPGEIPLTVVELKGWKQVFKRVEEVTAAANSAP